MTFSIIGLENKLITTNSGLSIQRPGLYPSEASVEYLLDGIKIVLGKCMRASWYRSMDIPMGCIDAKLAMTGWFGKACENDAIERWKRLGLYVDSSIKFYNRELVISGELDCVIKNPDDNTKLVGYEIKSFYGYVPSRTIFGSKRPPIPGVPKDNHFLQTSFYAWQYRDTIDEYRMYYVERGDGSRAEFRIGAEEGPDGTHQCWWEQLNEENTYWNEFRSGRVYQPYTVESIIDRYKKLINHLRNKQLPPTDFQRKWDDDKVEFMYDHGMVSKTNYEKWQKSPGKNPLGDWQCGYCEYRAQCEQDELTSAIGDTR